MEPFSPHEISRTFFDELPKESLSGVGDVYQWQGFWFWRQHVAAAIAAKSRFEARDEDVILASSMKTGTTWLKAIIPCIINSTLGNGYDYDYDPFVENHPNALIPSLEVQLYCQDPIPDLSGMPSPRLFRTHIAYPLLSESIKNSACKIVYITRNPKDVFVSLWHFMNTKFSYPFDESFDKFCKGVHLFGPFHDHVLGYWNESVKRPEKILFLKYEELKSDPKGQIQKLASFLGRTSMKEKEVENVIEKCSLKRMKSLEINKNGVDPYVGFTYKSYFRQGSVGDWKNKLSEEMKERLDKITKMKLEGSGLEL
ncbi:cytosolic sulfotransferase 5 [Ricinus communis]|uniref:Sulfotransferase n=1 Tax=Ricinus communis TaxID=3988 RepID=B9SIV6_RICCO|nr:cytosolic sulfotransferase 5 [Ricinus communis]EEF36445.1 Flavonol 4'-sulfotransferase, putative [Ricinus communis]|eukprot:XP_002525925.1 cytosolic sulfotransferase 5 [Ricinus communis]